MKVSTTIKYTVVPVIIFSIFLLACSAFANDDYLLDKSRTLIKVDSAGLKGRVLVTGIGYPPNKSGISAPQVKLLAKRAAIIVAYNELLSAVKDISLDFFPKERYLLKSGYIRGAQLLETRYYGDGSVEVDVGLDIALKGALVEKFEKDMRLSGYRVIECDSSRSEITKEEWEKLIEGR